MGWVYLVQEGGCGGCIDGEWKGIRKGGIDFDIMHYS